MELQSSCCGIRSPNTRLSSKHGSFSLQTVSRSFSFSSHISISHVGFKDRRIWFQNAFKNPDYLGLKRTSSKGVIVYAEEPSSEANFNPSGKEEAEMRLNGVDEVEPFHGKSGSVSFRGTTHQLVEEGKRASSPLKEGTGSLLWVLAPLTLISSIVLPQFVLSTVIDVFIRDEILTEVAASICSELIFYIGLAIFLLITNHVQKPYLQFSTKSWGLITDLRGCMTSAFIAIVFKFVASVLAVYITWPVLGFPALVAVAPFLVGCLVQIGFEDNLNRHGSSCWPLVPIIFEVYRIYQLTKASHFIERLMFAMKDVTPTPDVLERGSAMVAMVVTFQILGFVCLWSLLTFLLRLFPSRPVSESY